MLGIVLFALYGLHEFRFRIIFIVLASVPLSSWRLCESSVPLSHPVAFHTFFVIIRTRSERNTFLFIIGLGLVVDIQIRLYLFRIDKQQQDQIE